MILHISLYISSYTHPPTILLSLLYSSWFDYSPTLFHEYGLCSGITMLGKYRILANYVLFTRQRKTNLGWNYTRERAANNPKLFVLDRIRFAWSAGLFRVLPPSFIRHGERTIVFPCYYKNMIDVSATGTVDCPRYLILCCVS